MSQGSFQMGRSLSGAHCTSETALSSSASRQATIVVPAFTLESGVTLTDVPVAYQTWGSLGRRADNVVVVCHDISEGIDVDDWWGPLLGRGKVFDTSRFFVICCNSLGSPHGTASPVTINPEAKRLYGPEFPLTTIRDDVHLHKPILDQLRIKQVLAVVGASMGGMLVLEWAYFGPEYVRAIIPIATSARHSAWGISWGEVQRQCIFLDPVYDDGYYPVDKPPRVGLKVARMNSLLARSSAKSFQSRFAHAQNGHRQDPTPFSDTYLVKSTAPSTAKDEARLGSSVTPSAVEGFSESIPGLESTEKSLSTTCITRSYLHYRAESFAGRFDANCYITLTRKMDTHDVSRGRTATISEALGLIKQPALVIGIQSDGLFVAQEQEELAASIPHARFAAIESVHGHDAFLLHAEDLAHLVKSFLDEFSHHL